MTAPGYTSPFSRFPGLRGTPPVAKTVSVVVPFYNEEDCVEFVLREIVACQPEAEIVAVDDGISDTGCSLKAIQRDHVDLLVPFNGLHRYLPAIFTHAGLRMTEVFVNHRERKAGTSKYTNLDRAIRGIYDLVGVCWLLRRKVILPPLETGPTVKSAQSQIER